MHTENKSSTGRRSLAPLLALSVALALGAQPSEDNDACRKSAAETLKSCKDDASSAFWLARANCWNLPTSKERISCVLDALAEMKEAKDECAEQFAARKDLCAELGGGIYHPRIDPDDFVDEIDNPYLPFTRGKTFVYMEQGEDEPERIDLTVLDDTVEILGVECTVVHDVVSVDGVPIEDTFDWFAQDRWGNVWYFGELSFELEDGVIVSTAGSWKAGEDFAQPGIAMLAAPKVGDVYRQEFFIGEAEDAAGVLSLNANVTVPYGSFTHCLQTEDFTPISPDSIEHKFYAKGVGLLLELDPESGKRTELIDVEANGGDDDD